MSSEAAYALTSAPCTLYWTGRATSSWITAQNWSLTDGGTSAGRTPSAHDDVCMSASPTTPTVVYPSGNVTIGGISFAQSSSLSPTLELQGGVLTIGSATASIASVVSNITLDSGASVAGSATLDLTGVVDAAGGNSLYGSGTKTLDATGTASINGLGVGTGTAPGQFVNNGAIALSGAALTLGTGTSSVVPASIINNGTMTVTNRASFTVTGSGTRPPQMINSPAGTITTGDALGTSITVPFANSGTVRASTGPVTINDGSPTGSPDNGRYDTPGFQISLSGGTRTLAAGSTVTGANGITVTGGSVAFATGVPVSNLTLAGGTVTGSPTVAAATLTNGLLTGVGTMTLTGISTLAYPTVDSGYRVLNKGQATGDDTTGNYLRMTNSGVVENAGTYTNTTPYAMQSIDSTSNQVLNDAGATWVVNVPTSAGTGALMYAPFDNHGAVSIVSGSFYPTQNTTGGADTGTYAISAGAQLDLGGGTRNFSGATQTGAGSFHLDSGTVTGTVTVADANLDAGTLTGAGTLTVAPSGTATIGYPTVDNGYRVLNKGQATGDDTTGNSLRMTNSGVVENAGTYTSTTPYAMQAIDTSANQVVNDVGATWVVNVPTSSGPGTTMSVPFDNHGTVQVINGALGLQAGNTLGGSDTGTYSEAEGAAVNMAQGARQLSGTSSSTGAGTFTVTGGSVAFATGVPVSNLTLAGGTVTGSPTVAAATLTNGLLTGVGTMTLTGISTLAYPTVDSGYRVLNKGQATGDDTTGNYLRMTNSGVVENAGTYTNTTPYAMQSIDSTSNQVLNDAGATWVVNVPTSAGTGALMYAPFDNHGAVSIVSGSFYPTQNTTGGADTGTYAISAGAQLDLGGGTRNFSGATQTGAGSFHLDSGTVTGTVTVADANLDAGTLTGAGTLTVAPSGTATIGYPTVDNGYRVLNKGQATGDDTTGNSLRMTNSGVVENAGTYTSTTPYAMQAIDTSANQVVNDVGATWVVNVPTSSGPGTTISAPFTNNGTLLLTKGTMNATSLTNLSSGSLTGGTYVANTGTLEVGANITTNAATIVLGPTGGITNAGTNALSSLGSNTGSLTLGQGLTTNAALANSGTITVNAHTLQAPSVAQTAGTITVNSGANLKANPIQINGGILTGTGTVTGQVSGTGTVAPGSPTGNLTVTGGYAPSSAGTLAITVAASGASQLVVSGTATLSGSLAITTPSGFTPVPGTSYQILTAATLNATFTTVSGLDIPGFYYTLAYSSNRLTLTVHQTPNVSVNDVSITQQPSLPTTATFTVSLDAPSLRPVTVSYATQDSTGSAGSDYQAASGSVTFPGDGTTTVESVPVAINPDPSCDPNEVFTVALSGPTNATIIRPTGTATIVNNASCATVPGSPTGLTASPGSSSAVVTFIAAPANGSPITSYTVTATDHTTGSNGGQTASGPGSPISSIGLTNGDVYTFTATATNGLGSGPASTPSNAVTPTAPAPTVTKITPGTGPSAGNTVVTVTGTGFSVTSTVRFGTAAATKVSYVSATKLKATSPAGGGTVDITVTNTGSTSATTAADRFRYATAPAVTSLNPNAGPIAGGQVVTINGIGLTGATKVVFGKTAATNFTVVSDTQVTVTSPAHTAGIDAVHVTTAAGTSPTVTADTFTYNTAPTVASISPATGPPTGGTVVTVTGTGFTPTSTVAFGTSPVTSFTYVSPTTVEATSPAGTGIVDITVTTSGENSAIVTADRYTY